MMNRTAVYFNGQSGIELREERVEDLTAGAVLIKTLISAISAGTELLFYRGQLAPGTRIDESIAGYRRSISYPLKYGYAVVGEIIAEGPGLNGLVGKKVFAFHPHESLFTAGADEIMPLAPGLPVEEAVLLPFMETAVSLVMDGGPLIGEQIVVFGQGTIGLLVTALLERFPLAGLFTLDNYESRREKSLSFGADICFDPMETGAVAALRGLLTGKGQPGADLAFELSGDPRALDEAIRITGFNGRIIIGSWYGTRQATLDLGSSFHRNRISLTGSQVSSINPRLAGRWDRKRRTETALRMIDQIRPAQSLCHTIPFLAAAEAYDRLDRDPSHVLQILLTYE